MENAWELYNRISEKESTKHTLANVLLIRFCNVLYQETHCLFRDGRFISRLLLSNWTSVTGFWSGLFCWGHLHRSCLINDIIWSALQCWMNHWARVIYRNGPIYIALSVGIKLLRDNFMLLTIGQAVCDHASPTWCTYDWFIPLP
jgi:hypothetical protein